ncbi:MAG TPA: hypothetical protein VGR45_04940, partial [Stellaceae bacterium]|nr:hypothetical protein [Stellaceae bacterium]
MTRSRSYFRALIAVIFGVVIAAGPDIFACRSARAADPDQAKTARPAVGRPLREAQALLAAHRYAEALAKIRQADAVKNKTPYETLVVEELRGFAEKGAGDNLAAIKSFETIAADRQLSLPEQARFSQEIGLEYYNIKDYPNAIKWAMRSLKADETATETHLLLAQSYYLTGDYAGAARELQSQTATFRRANRPPPENELIMLADCARRQNDDAAYAAQLEQLVLLYPRKEYWLPLLRLVERKPGFTSRLELDFYRLKLATGTLNSSDDYLEMAQLALADGLPGDARQTIEQGYATGVLGSGTAAARQNRLRDLATNSATQDQKELAHNEAEAGGQRDGTGLVEIGLDYIGYGQLDKGAALVKAGIERG